MTETTEPEVLIADKRVEATGRGNDDVRVRFLVLELLDILVDLDATVEDRCPDVRDVFAEPCVLVLDLEGELSSVAHDQYGGLAIDRFDLLESGQDENGGLS